MIEKPELLLLQQPLAGVLLYCSFAKPQENTVNISFQKHIILRNGYDEPVSNLHFTIKYQGTN